MSADWSQLPDILWYSICEYLPNITDIIHLSCTNRTLYRLMDDHAFWRHLIRLRFGPILLRRYCDEIFSQHNTRENLCASIEFLLEFERQYSQLPGAIRRNGWNLMVTGAQNGDLHGFAAAKRAKFHLPKLKSALKMAMAENDFRRLIAQNSSVNLYKLIYWFLSQKIRLSFANDSFLCLDATILDERQHPKSIVESSSDFGSVALLELRWLAAIRGEFHSIIPGRYAVICRMKLDLLRYEEPSDEDQFTGEFTCIPEFGLMSSVEWDQDWFDLHYVINRSKNQPSTWFEEQMGIITVYELSTVYFGLRIWQIPYRKYAVMCDSVQLKIVE